MPPQPVYCIYPEVYGATARAFRRGFDGRVLYAVKANDHPAVLRALYDGGIRHFDCASVPEIALVREHCPEATPYFMIPARLRGAAREAQREYGVRHYMIDDIAGLAPLVGELSLPGTVLFTRVAVHHASASQDLSSKFGAAPESAPALLQAVAEAGAEPALAFNVGSAVLDPAAYAHALAVVADVLHRAEVPIRLLDIGGGYPRRYPGFPVPPLADYFDAIETGRRQLPLADDAVLLSEPGRALAAPGMGALVEVLLRKDSRLYLNDGMYGVFWELRFGMQGRYAVRCWRGGERLRGETRSFTLFGPTCDSSDVLPEPIELPVSLRAGDVLEFGEIGAYSLAGRTDFNGHRSDHIVEITGPGRTPPS